MLRLARSFYGKLCAVLIFLLLLLGASQLFVLASFSSRYTQERDQVIQWSLARQLAERFQPHVESSIDYSRLERLFHESLLLNPRTDLYLLDADGNVVLFFGPEAEVLRRRVDVKPIERFLKSEFPERLPIAGDNPRAEKGSEVFSAARITLKNQPGFLYAILASGGQQPISTVIRTSYILKNALVLFALGFIIVAAIGMVSFFAITNRVEKMTVVVREFGQGKYEHRIPVNAKDEIAELGTTFNRMADTIQDNIQQLEHMDSQRREFVANVAHDLRGPLTSVYGYLDTLVQDEIPLTADDKKSAIETAYRNTKGLMKLVKELFELARLEAHDVEPEIKPLDVSDLFAYLNLKHVKQAEAKKIEWSVIPCADAETKVLTDGAMLERVLSNLVDNAIKYTPEGGKVVLRAEKSNGSITFRVEDTGEGIASEDVPKIFTRFFRTQATLSKKSGGTGLGLAIVKKIVEAHDSTIEVTSAVGQGTTFSFTLKADESG